MARMLSENFTLDEFVFSQTAARLGIDNTPSPEVLANLKRLAQALEQAAGRERQRRTHPDLLLLLLGQRHHW